MLWLSIVLLVAVISCKEDEIIEDVEEVAEIQIDAFSHTMEENPAANTVIGDVKGSTTIGAVVFSLTNQSPQGALSLDNQDSQLLVADSSLFDFETHPTITATITATAEGVSKSADVVITLTDVDESSISATDFAITLAENPTKGQVLGTIQATANGDAHFAMESQTPEGALGLNTDSGELSVADSSLFDFEVNPTLTAKVLASSGSKTDTVTVTITLTDVSEDSISLTDLSVAVDENPKNAQLLGTIEVTSTGSPAFALESQSLDGAISIDANSGAITVADSSLFDYEANTTVTAKVVATLGIVTDTADVTITVEDVDESLTALAFTATVDENPASGKVIGTVNVTGYGSSSYKLNTQSLAGAIAINATTGQLTVLDPAIFDYETNTTLTAEYEVTNGIDTQTETITIDIANVEELDPDAFVTYWKTAAAGESVYIPINSGYTYNYTVDWGDGNIDSNQSGASSHTYTDPGTYTVSITGDFPAIAFGPQPLMIARQSVVANAGVLIAIRQWGSQEWQSMLNGFKNCTELTYSATDAPNLTNLTSLEGIFSNATKFNGNLNSWDVSTVTNFRAAFRDASAFNGDISSWDVSAATSMQEMFYNASVFNQDLSKWDVSSVTDFTSTFRGALAFNSDISDWDVSSATSLAAMFNDARVFNQDISDWVVSNVTSMANMFRWARAFNQDISDWDVSSVTNMYYMFGLTTAFNQDISNWDVSSVKSMQLMFWASGFNQSLADWDLSSLTNAEKMLEVSQVSMANYEATLIGWAANTNTPDNVNFRNTGRQYSSSAAVSARNVLVGKGWNLTGDVYVP